MSVFGISFGKNDEQYELSRLISENSKTIIFATGRAGTGKTFATLATALQLQDDKKYSKIIYARNPVQVGEDMGFLPGDVDEKYLPFMGPLMDNLENLVRLQMRSNGNKPTAAQKSLIKSKVEDLKNRVEICPIAFLRGRSMEDTILIIDEAQNLDLTALKTVLTRVGKYCKIILLGSLNQIDNWRQRKKSECDFVKVMNKLNGLPYVGCVDLKLSMRSPICVEVDELLSEIKEDTDEVKVVVNGTTATATATADNIIVD